MKSPVASLAAAGGGWVGLLRAVDVGDRISFLLITWECTTLLPVWRCQGAGSVESSLDPRAEVPSISGGSIAGLRGVFTGVFSTIIVSPGVRHVGVVGTGSGLVCAVCS